jgi:cobalt/nickel transport system permease protein
MHIPDGFLSTTVAVILWVLAAGFIAYALYQTRRQLGERTIPLMGVLAAFIFAAQAINFPVAGGTSGHLIGAALAAILLGPWPAVLVMTCVLGVQSLLFQDGGLLALGGNILNMAVLASLVAALAHRGIAKLLPQTRSARLAATFVAAWLTVVLASMACAFELAASSASPLGIVLPSMTFIHMLIGIGEGLITVAALAFIQVVRPDLAGAQMRPAGMRSATLLGGGLLIALIVSLFSPLASPLPDGLDHTAEQLMFAERAREPLFNLLPDYSVSFLSNPALSTIVAVAIGTVVVFVIALILGRTVGRKHDAVAS